MWDISWVCPKDIQPISPFSLKLACEIEWNGKQCAIIDFRKLVVCTAENVIMIFDKEKSNRYLKKAQEMVDIIPDGVKKKYLLIGVKSNHDQRKHLEHDKDTHLIQYDALEVRELRSAKIIQVKNSYENNL